MSDASERFWAKVQKTDTCWLWTGSKTGRGDPAFFLDGKQITAHYYLVGKPPAGTCWRHSCGVQHCVNPDHLEPGKTGPQKTSADDRFWAKVDKTDTCWLWTGAIMPNGYGYFAIDASKKSPRNIYAHQFLVGIAPDGLVWDHLCRNRSCVKPDHLEAVTQAENVRRGVHWSTTKTHCAQGHPWIPENIWQNSRQRGCKICKRQRSSGTR